MQSAGEGGICAAAAEAARGAQETCAAAARLAEIARDLQGLVGRIKV